MVCKNCGSELTENEKFCPKCGQAAESVENPTSETNAAIETSEEKAPIEDTTKTEGEKKAQSGQWDSVKKNLQQGAEIAVPILKAGFGKAKEFTAQTVHEFKDAATEVKGTGVSGASVAVAVKKINWKRLIPVGVALVLLILIIGKGCGSSKVNPVFEEYTENGKVDYVSYVKELSFLDYPNAPLKYLMKVLGNSSWATIDVSGGIATVSASGGGGTFTFAVDTKTGVFDLVGYGSYSGQELALATESLLNSAYSVYQDYRDAGIYP